jgi:hypothetical protein
MSLSIARGGARPPSHLRGLPAVAAQVTLAGALIAAGWFAASRLTLVAPGPYARDRVLEARPADLPTVPGARLVEAGPGEDLAYRLEYLTAAPAPDARASLLREPAWFESVSSSAERLELIRRSPTGSLDYIARYVLREEPGGTRVSVEFSPLPVGLAPPRPR